LTLLSPSLRGVFLIVPDPNFSAPPVPPSQNMQARIQIPPLFFQLVRVVPLPQLPLPLQVFLVEPSPLFWYPFSSFTPFFFSWFGDSHPVSLRVFFFTSPRSEFGPFFLTFGPSNDFLPSASYSLHAPFLSLHILAFLSAYLLFYPFPSSGAI